MCEIYLKKNENKNTAAAKEKDTIVFDSIC